MRAVAVLQRDHYQTLVGRLRGLAADYGPAFDATLAEEAGGGGARLTLRACLYHRLFEAEGLGQLTGACCCSQDRGWLEGASYRGVDAGLRGCIAEGDPACVFTVTRVPGGDR